MLCYFRYSCRGIYAHEEQVEGPEIAEASRWRERPWLRRWPGIVDEVAFIVQCSSIAWKELEPNYFQFSFFPKCPTNSYMCMIARGMNYSSNSRLYIVWTINRFPKTRPWLIGCFELVLGRMICVGLVNRICQSKHCIIICRITYFYECLVSHRGNEW